MAVEDDVEEEEDAGEPQEGHANGRAVASESQRAVGYTGF